MLGEAVLAKLIQVGLNNSLVMWISNWMKLINNKCHDFKIRSGIQEMQKKRQPLTHSLSFQNSVRSTLTKEVGRWPGGWCLENDDYFVSLSYLFVYVHMFRNHPVF